MLALPLLLGPGFPYHRQWQYAVPNQIDTAGVYRDVVYYGTDREFGVVRLADGKRIWAKTMPKSWYGASVTAADGTLFVASGNGEIGAYRLGDGQKRWAVPIRVYATTPLVVGRTAIVQLNPTTVAGLDVNSGKVRWRRIFSSSSQEKNPISAPSRAGDLAVFADPSGATYALDIATGKPRWQTNLSANYFWEFVQSDGALYASSSSGFLRLDPNTGKTLWRASTRGKPANRPLFSNDQAILHTNLGRIQAIDLSNGKERWASNLVDDPERYQQATSPVRVPEGILSFDREKVRLFDGEGRPSLEEIAPVEASGLPVVWTGKQLVVFGYTSIESYLPGARDVGADPSPRVRELLARFRKLSRPESRELASYGHVTMDEMVPLLASSLGAYIAAGRAGDPKRQQAYSDFNDLAAIAAEAMTPESTSKMLPIVRRAVGTEAEDRALMILRKGDDALTVPLMLEVVRQTPNGRSGVAMMKLIESSLPAAIRWRLETMRNPKTEDAVRMAIYPTLATSGEEGLAMARSLRVTERTLPPLTSRISLISLGKPGGPRQIATGKDSKGKSWLLFETGVVGSFGDLWIARKEGDRWVDPVFTGVNTSRVSQFVSRRTGPPKEDPKIKALLAGGWLTSLVGNPKLRQDSDGDGLTDLVEARLGTDPRKEDSDRDGLPDGIDANPLAPARALNVGEQVIQAALEARFRFDKDRVPGVLYFPKGFTPFEILGRGGVVVAVDENKEKWSDPLSKQYEQGVGLIHFSERRDAGELPKLAPLTDRYIRWNADRTEGTVTISNYYGGLNGTGYQVTVRRFDGDWLVVKMEMSWIS